MEKKFTKEMKEAFELCSKYGLPPGFPETDDEDEKLQLHMNFMIHYYNGDKNGNKLIK